MMHKSQFSNGASVISSGCLDLIVKDTFYRHKGAIQGKRGTAMV